MIDALETFRVLLAGRSAVTDHTGDRIFHGRIDPVELARWTDPEHVEPTIYLELTNPGVVESETVEVEINCLIFAASHEQAIQVAEAMHEDLDEEVGLSANGTAIVQLWQGEPPKTGITEEQRWNFVEVPWHLLLAKE